MSSNVKEHRVVWKAKANVISIIYTVPATINLCLSTASMSSEEQSQ